MLAIIKLKHRIFWVIYFQVFLPCELILDKLHFFFFYSKIFFSSKHYKPNYRQSGMLALQGKGSPLYYSYVGGYPNMAICAPDLLFVANHYSHFVDS